MADNIITMTLPAMRDAINKIKPQAIKFFTKAQKDIGIDNKFDGKTSDQLTVVNDNTGLNSATIDRMFDLEQRLEYDRYKVALMSRESYLADSRIKAGINGISYEATACDNDDHPYYLSIDGEDNPTKSQQRDFQACIDLNKSLELERMAPMIARKMCIDGDCFREVIVNFNTEEIVDFPELPGPKDGYLTRALIDKQTKRLAGWGSYRIQGINKLERVFAPWQVIQFPFDKDGWYGTPLLNTSTIDQKRLFQSESSMHKARDERAFVKLVHIFKDATYEQLRKYAKEYEDKLKTRQRGVQTDFFTSAEMQMFDPANEQLQNIADIEYFERKIFASIQRPEGIYGGYGKNVNRATLDKQYEAYLLFLSNISSSISSGYIKLFNLQLILRGRLPAELPLKLKWTQKESMDFLSFVRALGIAVDKGLSVDSFLEELNFNPAIEKQRREKENNIVARGQKSNDKTGGVKDTVDKNIAQRNSSKGQANDNLKEFIETNNHKLNGINKIKKNFGRLFSSRIS